MNSKVQISVPGTEGLITDPQVLAARLSIRWAPRNLAQHAKVLVSVVARAESSPGEPAITIVQPNALKQTRRAADLTS